MKRPWLFIVILIVVLTIAAFFMAFVASLFIATDVETSGSGNIALIEVKGVLVTDDAFSLFSDDSSSSTDIIELIEKANSNPSVQGIIFEINSPGGSAVASEEVSNAIKKVDKPTVAWIREAGASGGYWIASATDHIIASKMSITGSIGVIASYLEFSGLMDYYNVTYERLVSGKYKDMGTPFKELTTEERQKFQRKLDLIHDEFVSEVAQNRKMTTEQVEKVATGEFYLGSEALNLGLIDQIGSKDEAIVFMEQTLNTTVDVVEYKKHRSIFDAFAEALGKQSFHVGEGIGSVFIRRERLSIET